MSYIYGIEYTDVVMSILIGIALATLLYEKKGILSGGIITPAIISLFMGKLMFVLSTIAMIVILHIMVSYLKKHTIIFGRRLYAIILLLGVGLVMLSRLIMDVIHTFGYGLLITSESGTLLTPIGSIIVPDILLEMGLGMHYYGYVIGLLMVPIVVNDTQSQGLNKTIVALLAVSSITYISVTVIHLLTI